MIRPCKLCGKDVDFSEPWCDHETMEESAWIDIQNRLGIGKTEEVVVDDAISQVAKELGISAAKEIDKRFGENKW